MAISVKVPVASLIGALEGVLKEEKTKVSYDDYRKALKANDAAYRNKLTAWGKKVARLIAAGDSKVIQVWNNEIRFDTTSLTLPEKPEPDEVTLNQQNTGKVRELENAIAILNLSQEEFVNATTYKSVAQYL